MTVDFTTRFPPALLWPQPEDHSAVWSAMERPWTFRFLESHGYFGPGHSFDGGVFYPQHSLGQELDMDGSNASGGDYFEICGAKSYRLFSYTIDLRESSGRLRIVRRKLYRPPLEFVGVYEVDENEEEYLDEIAGGVVLQTRVNSAQVFTVYEEQGADTPPVFANVGSGRYSEPVDHATLESFANQWLGDISAKSTEELLTHAGGVSAVYKSGTSEGLYAYVQVGAPVVPLSLVAPPPPPPENPSQPPAWTLDGVEVWQESESRSLKPTVYHEDGDPVSGNAIYGRGRREWRLAELITQKIWKDARGTFDQTQEGLVGSPWYPGRFYAYPPRQGYGELTRGKFIPADAATYRITFCKAAEPTNTVRELIVSGASQEYWFDPVELSSQSFNVEVSKVEVQSGESWVDLGIEVIGPDFDAGIRLVHHFQQRVGERWGHYEFLTEFPGPATPAEERRYKLKILRKEARP